MAQRFSKLKSLFLLLGPKAFIQKHFTCDAEGRHLLRHRFLRRSGLPPPSSRLDAQEREREPVGSEEETVLSHCVMSLSNSYGHVQ